MAWSEFEKRPQNAFNSVKNTLSIKKASFIIFQTFEMK
jgi:hypothetical protein